MAGTLSWMHPDLAIKVRDVLVDVAQQVVAEASTFRMAKVVSFTDTSMVVNFADEPDNDVTIKLTGYLHPTAVGQNVEIEVRNGTDFVISQVFGAADITGAVSEPQTAPDPVTGLTLVSAERAVTATWDALPGVTSYEVQRAKDSAFTIGLVVQTVTANQLVVPNLLEGEDWFFRVRANNAAGTSDWSATEEVTVLTDTPAPGEPAQVTGLTLSTIPKQITAKWDALDEVQTYVVQRSVNSTFVTGVTSEEVTGTMLVVNDLEPGMEWFFRVRGVNSTGNGPWSVTDSVTVMLMSEWTDGAPPAASPEVTVTPGIMQLVAKWDPQPNDDLVTYEVHIGEVTNFTPSAATLLGETTSTFWITDQLPDGSPLVAETQYFMRVVAKDKDGAATPGGQGFATPTDISQIVSYEVISGDGFVPGTPAAPVITSGIGYLYASWERPSSPDPLQYEVHVSSVGPSFVPDANTLSLVTGSLFGFIRKQGPGAGGATLVYGTTYWVKIIAVDVDGVSLPSPAGSGFTVKTNTADIVAGSITATEIYSGAVMAQRIQGSNIAANTITSSLLYVGAVEANKIQAANITTGVIAVGSALIQTGAIGTAMIGSLQVTDGKINDLAVNKLTTQTLTATVTVSGVIKTSAGTARVEMSSAGLYAYNSGGGTTFYIDSSGNAYFQGNIYAVNGTFTGTISSSAEIVGGTITGATIRSASSGARVSLGTFSYSASEMGQSYGFGPYPAVTFHNSSNQVSDLIYADGYSLHLNRSSLSGLHVQSARVYCDISFEGTTYIKGYGLYDSGYRVYSPVNPPSYPVNSVNGYTGSPYLSYSDVGAASSGHNHAGTYLTGGGSEQPTFAYVFASAYYSGSNYIGPNTATSLRVGSGGGERYLSLSSVGVGATKTFVIEHPSEKDKYLVHAAIEGPTADVFYRGEGQLQPDGGYMEDTGATRVARVTIELPKYFEELTEKEGRTVQITPIAGFCSDPKCRDFLPPSMAVGPVVDGKFTVYATAGFQHDDAKFYWEVTAVRKNTKFATEPSKKDYKVRGDGPYTYLTPA